MATGTHTVASHTHSPTGMSRNAFQCRVLKRVYLTAGAARAARRGARARAADGPPAGVPRSRVPEWGCLRENVARQYA